MLPVKTNDKTLCLSSLISVRADCVNEAGTLFYLEDIEGLDIKKLANIANVNNPSGKGTGYDLINSAARQMMGDIELLIANGFSLVPAFGETYSTCDFAPTYLNAGGVKITNVIGSKYGKIIISRVEIAANYTGDATLVIDDGTPRYWPVQLEAGVISTNLIDYSTDKKIVRVYLSSNTIGMALVDCPVNTDCGCGGRRTKSVQPIRYSGIIGNNDSANQYGFKISSTVECSYENLVCDLINQLPGLFGATLLYKCGQIYYITNKASERNNRTTGIDAEEKDDMARYYQGLYNTRMQGSRQTKGLRQVISAYLQRNKDKCVICDNITKAVPVSG